MFVDALLLAFAIVAWVAYVLYEFFGTKKQPSGSPNADQRFGLTDVFYGGTAKKDRGEISMTETNAKKQAQYGFVDLSMPIPDAFTFRFELLIEDPAELGVPVHAFVWLGLGGDPDKESSVSSNAIEDGSTRLFLLKTDAFGQRETLEVFRTIAGIARPSSKGSSWDLTERVQYMPKNQWVLVTLSGDLRSRTFRMTVDDAQYSFVVPMRFEWSQATTRAYLGAKTLKGTGIRIRNLGIAT